MRVPFERSVILPIHVMISSINSLKFSAHFPIKVIINFGTIRSGASYFLMLYLGHMKCFYFKSSFQCHKKRRVNFPPSYKDPLELLFPNYSKQYDMFHKIIEFDYQLSDPIRYLIFQYDM